MSDGDPKPSTPDRIKEAAQRLIAEHGVDGVSVREIVIAAGQKNMASLHYYFGTKENLIKELVVDAAKLMEGQREEALSALEKSGVPIVLRDVVAITIGGAILDIDQGGRAATVLRFLGAVTGTHRHLFDEAIGKKYNKCYQRCLELIRRCLPQIPPSVLNQRLLFMSISSYNVLITREAAIAFQGHARAYWGAPRTLGNFLDYICAGLSAPVSEAAIGDGGGQERSPLGLGRHFTMVKG
jgi:AcrR family transcriptional regulator